MFDFKKFRKDKKLRQDYFVELFCCTQGYISQLENKLKPITYEQLELLRANFNDVEDYITEILPENTNNTTTNKFYEELILSQQRTIEAQTKIILDMQLKNNNAPRSDAICVDVAG